MPTPAQNKATAKYIKTHLKRYTVHVNRDKEPELVEWLDGHENKTQYILGLVRKDMHESRGE